MFLYEHSLDLMSFYMTICLYANLHKFMYLQGAMYKYSHMLKYWKCIDFLSLFLEDIFRLNIFLDEFNLGLTYTYMTIGIYANLCKFLKNWIKLD